MPAATIVAAWIRAETGVGPSIASGSHTWSGSWADLPTAPQKSRSGIAPAVDRVPRGRLDRQVAQVDRAREVVAQDDPEEEPEVPHPVR